MSLLNLRAKTHNGNYGYLSYQPFQYSYNYYNTQALNPFDIYKESYNKALNNYSYNSSSYEVNTNQTQDKKITLKSGKIAEILEEAGYDSQKAKKLTKAAKKRAREHGWRNSCAYESRMSLEEAGLIPRSNGNGDAYRYISLLGSNRNFREIDVSKLSQKDLIELSKFDGITYVYDRGKNAKYSKKHGHIEISLGNGTNGSDGITHYIKTGARVFIPVKTPYSAIA